MTLVPVLLAVTTEEWVYLSVDDDDPINDETIREAAEGYAKLRGVELAEVRDYDRGERDGENDARDA